MHPWHDLDVGDDLDAAFPVVIETPKDWHVQYAVDSATGLLSVKRVLFGAVHYPANYGFIPRTMTPDGDPLDVLVLGQYPIEPLAIARARAIALVEVREAKQRDDKIVAVHVDDPVFAEYDRFEALPAYLMREIRQFFVDYRALEHDDTSVGGVRGRDDAMRVVHAARQAYRLKFGKVHGN